MPPTGISVKIHHDGQPVTVVLVHGAPDRGSTFRKLLEHIPDLRVVTYDRRGYGRSVEARPAAGMEDHAVDLLAIVSEQPEPCMVVAHSFGSNPAMLAAATEPDAFPALGLFEPPLPWVDWWPQSTKDYNARVAVATDSGQVGEEMARRLLGEKKWMTLSEDARALRRAEGRAFQTDMASALTAPFELASIRVPTVVAYATDTYDDRRRGGPWLAAELPNAQLFVVEGGSHFSHRTHPGPFSQFIRAVVDLVPGVG